MKRNESDCFLATLWRFVPNWTQSKTYFTRLGFNFQEFCIQIHARDKPIEISYPNCHLNGAHSNHSFWNCALKFELAFAIVKNSLFFDWTENNKIVSENYECAKRKFSSSFLVLLRTSQWSFWESFRVIKHSILTTVRNRSEMSLSETRLPKIINPWWSPSENKILFVAFERNKRWNHQVGKLFESALKIVCLSIYRVRLRISI